MEQEINKILQCIDKISEKGHKSKFSEEFQKSVSIQSKVVSEYLGISSERQSICWSIFFSLSLHRSSIDLEDISNYLNTTVLKVLQYQVDIDELVKRKLLRREKSDHGRRRIPDRLNSIQVFVPSDIIISLTNGVITLPPRTKENLNVYELLDIISNTLQERDNELIDYRELCEEIESLLDENSDCPFVQKIKRYKLPILELIILLSVCCLFTQNTTSIDLIGLLKTILPDTQSQLRTRKDFLNNKTKLQQLDLIDLESEVFKSDRYIDLTPKGRDLFGEDQNLFIEKVVKNQKDIILSSGIQEQKLFFNENERKSIEFLTDLLRPDNYNSVVNRMKDMGMKQGLTVLLHGHPGTGKTESVYQISRITGRDIKRVEMSETKSKWFGESEKLIKKVFDSYKQMVKTTELTPILLFNEVDGIFGSRKTLGNSPVDQTENTIQNIILQEMEDFNGILLSTTNLPRNLDKGFERRFLYKIYFDKPNSETRFLIWKDKLPVNILTNDQIMDLSQTYENSGGQIQNVTKKIILTQILTGISPLFQEIEDLCEGEFLERKSKNLSVLIKIVMVI